VPLPLHPQFIHFSKKQSYLLAISGGRDSVALFHSLRDAGYRDLILCHLNHSLRGKESDQDAAFVHSLADKHDLPYEIQQVDILALAEKSGKSMELAARNARHSFFARCAKKHQTPHVLLAHHANDQAETILFNLIRGSAGLKGIHFSQIHQVQGTQLTFMRPLLQVTREAINFYIQKSHLDFREDASNAEPIATRNRIRNEVMPLLDEIMGRSVAPAITRAESISTTNERALKATLSELELTDPQGRLFLPKVNELAPALQSIVLHDYLKNAGISDISQSLLKSCMGLMQQTSPAKINLPGGRFLRRKEKRLFITPTF